MQVVRFIPEHKLDWLKAIVFKLNARANKLGVAPMSISTNPAPPLYECRNPSGTTYWSETQEKSWNGNLCPRVEVSIYGDSPKYKDWQFVAVLSPTEHGNIIQTVPGDTQHDCTGFVERTGECDHCHTRRKRNETFVVHNIVTKEYKVVGRACLKDFLGHTSPMALAEWASCMFSLESELTLEDDESFRLPRELACADLQKYLAVVVAIVRSTGYINKARAEDECKLPTSVVAFDQFHPPRGMQIETIETEEYDVTFAAKVIDWMKSLDADGNNYYSNLKVIAHNEYVTWKTIGYAASAVVSYQKCMEESTGKTVSDHIGLVGSRFDLRVKVTGTHPYSTSYGSSCVHRMVDVSGNLLVWFASGTSRWLEYNREYVVRVTVKEHGEYRGQKQTVVNRVEVRSEYPLESEAAPATA